MSSQPYFAICPRGLEEALAQELAEIGVLAAAALPAAALKVDKTVNGGVHFSGQSAAVYAANLHSRIASRILQQVANGPYRSEDDIYSSALGVAWEKHMRKGQTLRVDLTARKSPLKSLNFTTLKIKDGVCDRLRDKTGDRPDVDTVRPDVRIFGHLTEDRYTLYLDTSGEPLFKRGWRTQKGEAPLKENLAAGILRRSGWQPGQPFYDPMCGSGTFLIEAAQLALGIAPGANRRFGFEQLSGFDGKVWKTLRGQARDIAGRNADRRLRIAGSDISGDMLEIAHANWEHAGLPGEPWLKQLDARFARPPFDEPGVMLLNPPYGERIAVRGKQAPAERVKGKRIAPAKLEMDPRAEEEANEFAATFASTLKQAFAGWTIHVLTDDLDLPRRMRLKESRRTPLFNGPIECRLFRIAMVAGSARQ
ncbi:MAG: class I SAM-dependent RNA methyltransferase [Candidatus Protistobacter heckmanni]|nr:class I SAM-dependent RNA methyltransferase [Candidatus Protistobacter heckmanni]